MVFYAAFNSILDISLQQPALFMSLGSEVSCPWTLLKKIPRIQCGSHSGSLDYKSNTLPLSHTGSLHHVWIRMKLTSIKRFWSNVSVCRLFTLTWSILLADAPTSLFTKHGSLLLSDSPIVWTSLLFQSALRAKSTLFHFSHSFICIFDFADGNLVAALFQKIEVRGGLNLLCSFLHLNFFGRMKPFLS